MSRSLCYKPQGVEQDSIALPLLHLPPQTPLTRLASGSLDLPEAYHQINLSSDHELTIFHRELCADTCLSRAEYARKAEDKADRDNRHALYGLGLLPDLVCLFVYVHIQRESMHVVGADCVPSYCPSTVGESDEGQHAQRHIRIVVDY